MFGFFGGSSLKKVEPVDWTKNNDGHFHRLSQLDPAEIEVVQAPMIYIIWHGGAKPGWVYLGISHDLPTEIIDIRQNKDILQYGKNGRLLVTWSIFREDDVPGVFSFLNDILMPVVRSPDAELHKDRDPIRVLPPGYDKETFVKAFEN